MELKNLSSILFASSGSFNWFTNYNIMIWNFYGLQQFARPWSDWLVIVWILINWLILLLHVILIIRDDHLFIAWLESTPLLLIHSLQQFRQAWTSKFRGTMQSRERRLEQQNWVGLYPWEQRSMRTSLCSILTVMQ